MYYFESKTIYWPILGAGKSKEDFCEAHGLTLYIYKYKGTYKQTLTFKHVLEHLWTDSHLQNVQALG